MRVSWLAHVDSGNPDFSEWLDGAAQNFSTEMLGAIATFILIEVMLGSQKAKREKAELEAKEQQQKVEQRAELQKRLVREAGGQSNEIAKAALDRLRDEGWLTIKDIVALLKEANLEKAKLQGADLHEANLQAAYLVYAKLQEANLNFAKLRKVDLVEANLQQADLHSANLQEADLRWANLQQAILWDTNLRGASLWLASLREVKNIEEARFNEKTMLPDGEQWTPQIDMRRYTDPNHKDEQGDPDFWEPAYLKPDYEGLIIPAWVRKQAAN